jgi:putative phosphoesterase
MMEVIIASDNHGDMEILEKIRQRHQKTASAFLHCGDSQVSFKELQAASYAGAGGNCDYDSKYRKDLIHDLSSGVRILVTHGHYYDVKRSTQSLHYRAKEALADIVCYGHSHCIQAEKQGDILILNPGSTRYPRNTVEKTYARLFIEEERYLVEFLNALDGSRIHHFIFQR